MKNIFRIIAFLEGVSYILLLFIAVPIKYTMGDATYVRLLGMPHGILFISYIIMCFAYKRPKWVLRKNNWPKGSKNYKRIVAFVVCLQVTFIWGMLLTVIGLDGEAQGLILLICYLALVRYVWKTIVDGIKLIIPYIYLIASILPFGTFYIDWKYLRN